MKVVVVGSDLDLLDDLEHAGHEVLGYCSTSDKSIDYEYLGSHELISQLTGNFKIIVAVDDVNFRQEFYKNYDDQVITYISPLAHVSNKAKLGPGSVVYPHAYISSGVKVGRMVKIHVGVQIHHESEVKDYSVLAPRVVLLGRVVIEESSFIGSNSTIGPEISIGERVVIGMGSTVPRSVSSGSKAWGNPARVQ